MGTVYIGEDTLTQQRVAIKQLKPKLTTPELVERFRREGEALRLLNHPNIVHMLDAIEENDTYYIVMEYVRGGDLSALLKTGSLPLERCLKLALDLADALTRTHKLDIIHRDLKSANVLLAEDGTLRLTDFGVAHIATGERVTDTDAIVGTVDYLPPESFEDTIIDPRADIWAFGILLFEMITGERPFKGNGIVQTIMAITSQSVPDLEALCPDIPVALVDLIYRMLEKDRNDRIRSVRQIGLELENILHGRSVEAPSKTRFTPDTSDFLYHADHNLPTQTTSFVGREVEIIEISDLIDKPGSRLVTILAPGGMGKTRLVLEVARRYIKTDDAGAWNPENRSGRFYDGIYFIELAPLSDPANIAFSIADVTGYQFQSDGRTPEQQITAFLKNKQALLILDNFEHLLSGVGLLSEILKNAPGVQILVTSRQRLNLTGETLVNLEGMDFPEWNSVDDALEYTAVKLFLESAKRVQSGFEITDMNKDSVARICKQVQGLPLGILLAASWISMLSLEEIEREIQHDTDFLESDIVDLPERQRSIRSVFSYSWNLMTPDEQNTFMKLCVFRGGFTREAAQSITDARLQVLMGLMNKSLIRRDVESGRYQIHELLRQYGQEKLAQSNKAKDTYYTHARYFNQWMEQIQERYDDHRQIEAVEAIERDYDNIRTAWLYLIESGHSVELRGIVGVLQEFIMRKSWYADGYPLFEKAVTALRKLPPEKERDITLANMLAIGGYMQWFLGDFPKGKADALEALELLQPYRSAEPMCMAYLTLAWMENFQGNHVEAQRVAEQGLAQASQVQRKDLTAWFLWIKARSLVNQGKSADSLEVCEELIDVATTTGKPNRIGVAYNQKAIVLYNQHQFDKAEPLYRQALDYFKRCKFKWGIATTLQNLTNLFYHKGLYQEAHHYLLQAIKIRLIEHNESLLKGIMIQWSDILIELGEAEQATALLSCVIENRRQKTTTDLLKRTVSLLPEPVYEQAVHRGKHTDIDTLIRLTMDAVTVK